MKILLIIPQKPYGFLKKIILLLAKNKNIELSVHKKDFNIVLPSKFYNIIDKRFTNYHKSPLNFTEYNDVLEKYNVKDANKISGNYNLILDFCDSNLKIDKCFSIKTNFDKSELLNFARESGKIVFCDNSQKNNSSFFSYNYINKEGVINNYYKYLYSIPTAINFFLNNISSKKYPSNEKRYTTLFHYYFSLVAKLFYRKIVKKEFNWKLALYNNQNKSLKLISNEKGEFWADPFLINHYQKKYIFFEELKKSTPKGIISLLILNNEGNVVEKKEILNKSFHMSFPNVFEFQNSYYMLPEQIEANSLMLYKATNFPYGWTEFREIFSNVKAVDPVLLFHDNLFYLFTNIVEDYEYENNERMSIFYTDDLLNGEWKAHKKNPVKNDASSTRNGGKIYKEGEDIIRIAQDCRSSYGFSTKKMKITKLTPSEFEEFEIETIKIDNFEGNHTYNKDGDIALIDVLMQE